MPNQHTIPDNPPWKDEYVLRKLYQEQGLSMQAVGDVLGCSQKTISKWLKRNEIKTRKSNRQKLLTPKTDDRGYVAVYSRTSNGGGKAYMHRLLAVAEYGIETVVGKVVHHENNIPWDNRPENIEVKTQANHVTEHAKNEENGSILTEANVREIRRRYPDDCTLTHLAEKFGVSPSTVYDAYSCNTFKWVDA
jgi:predicted DNA-binding protein YlxM (UPF0122 family)